MRFERPPASGARGGRRRFLRAGVVGGAALAVGGVLAWHTRGYEVPPETARTLRALGPKEFLVVQALAARIVRPDAPDMPTPDEVGVAAFVDGLVARLDAANRSDLLRLLHVVEHALPLASGHASRFTQLAGPAQDAVLTAMMTSRVPLLRGAFEALKSLCVMGYFRDARSWAGIGYDGPLVGRPVGGWTPAASLVPRARERSR
jgi:hypothetical protein